MRIRGDEHPEKSAQQQIDEYDLYYGESDHGQDQIPHREPGPLSRRPSFNSLVPPVAVSFLFLACTFLFNNSTNADYLWASGETVFQAHEFWRLVTALFTHSGPLHLASNLPYFILFGMVLYEYFGPVFFPSLPLLIGTCANIVTLFFYDGTTRLIGASGMIYGMVSLWLVLYIYCDTGRTMRGRIFMSAGFTLAVMFPEAYYPSTSYLAHAAGFVCGILCGAAALPFAKVKTAAHPDGTSIRP